MLAGVAISWLSSVPISSEMGRGLTVTEGGGRQEDSGRPVLPFLPALRAWLPAVFLRFRLSNAD